MRECAVRDSRECDACTRTDVHAAAGAGCVHVCESVSSSASAANAPAVLVLADNRRASSLLLVVGSCALWEESPGLYVLNVALP
eukprot:COSAG03_NODE_8229_length_823_cov_1.488950_2_plen_84_part_00